MILKIAFGEDGSQSIEHRWDDDKDYATNMRQATIKAMENGMTLEQVNTGKVQFSAIKEREGECCPCCGSPLL